MSSTEQSEDQLDYVFSALSDRTRRGILKQVSEEEFSVSELAEYYDISLPGVMKHLKVLERAQLVHLTKEGRVRKCNLDIQGLRDAQAFVDEYKKFWEGQFDRIEAYLKKKN